MINGDGLDARQVLRNVEIACLQELAARNKKLIMAAAWADRHPPESIDPTQLSLPGGDRPIHPGGDGTPMLAGFCVAEFATTMHVSTGSAERFIADALDLRHRLPRLWTRVCRYEIEGWQAQQVAQETRHLTKEQAAIVDADIADQVGRQAWSQTLRRLQGKIIAVDAARIAKLAEQRAGEQGVWVGETNNRGQKSLFAKADAPDVIWFDAMVARIADILAQRGDERPQDARRAATLGILANPAHALRLLAEDINPTLFDPDLDRASGPSTGSGCAPETPRDHAAPPPRAEHGDRGHDGAAPPRAELVEAHSQEPQPHCDGAAPPRAELVEAPSPSTGSGCAPETVRDHAAPPRAEPVEAPDLSTDSAPAPRFHRSDHQALIDAIREIDPAKLRPDATLYVHIAEETLRQPGTGVTRVEDVGPVITELIKQWLQGCRVTVRPVINLNDTPPPSDCYEIPDRMREHTFLRQPSSVFPYASQTGRRLDLDHTQPYRPGKLGQTRIDNLAPIDRTGHRLVTHGGWQRRQPEPGTYLFRAPHGSIYLTNRSGTTDLGHNRFAESIWRAAAPDFASSH